MSPRLGLFASMLLALALPAPAMAQAPELGWSYSAQLTAVWTGGNSEASTFGLGSTVRRLGERDEVKLEAGGIRSEASLKSRRAVETGTGHRIEEEEEREKTAESYVARARYDRTVTDGFVFFSGVDWSRNTFAGIDSRFIIAAGVGNLWAQSDDFRFKTDLAATYAFQEDVVDNPFVKSKFPGVRFSWDLMRTLTSTSVWESTFVSDLNVDDTGDLRLDLNNSLAVSVSSRIALKPGLQVLWRNQPSMAEVDLFNPIGLPTGRTVLTPLEKMDSFFTLALVVTL